MGQREQERGRTTRGGNVPRGIHRTVAPAGELGRSSSFPSPHGVGSPPFKAVHFLPPPTVCLAAVPPKRVELLALTHAHLLLQEPLLLHSFIQCQADPLSLRLWDDKLLAGRQGACGEARWSVTGAHEEQKSRPKPSPCTCHRWLPSSQGRLGAAGGPVGQAATASLASGPSQTWSTGPPSGSGRKI